MHVLGKVLLFFVFAGAAAAVFLSARALEIRSKWMDKAQKLEKQVQDNEVALKEKRATLQQTRNEFSRVMLGWDRMFPGIGGGVQPNGVAQLSVGRPFLEDKQVVQLFAVDAAGQSLYLGPFKVTALADNRSGLAANWRVRPGDIPNLPGGVTFRVRTLVPPSYPARFDELEVQLSAADERVAANQRELEAQTAQIQVAEEHLALRLKEINGDADLKGKDLPPEAIEGLLAVIVTEEEARNAALAEDDRLRRRLKEAIDAFNKTRAENGRLANGLPQPSRPSASASPAENNVTSR